MYGIITCVLLALVEGLAEEPGLRKALHPSGGATTTSVLRRGTTTRVRLA